MSFDKNKEMFKDMLEKILFDETKLDKLKEMITKLNNETLSARKFRENLFHQRQEIFQELLDFFPFYVEHLQKSKAIDNFVEGIPENASSEELKERDDLLIETYNRLLKIREKLNIS